MNSIPHIDPVAGGVYAIVNRVNGKVYVGSAVRFRTRFKLHRTELRRGSHHSIKLQRAWDKHGEDQFAFVPLEYVGKSQFLLEREQFWLDAFQSARVGYNMLPTAGSRLGMKSSDEHRAKISAALTGRRLSPEHRAKLSAAASSRTPEVAAKIAASRPRLIHSEATKARVADKLRGIVRSAETRAKIGEASKGRTHSAETKAKRLATRRANDAMRRLQTQRRYLDEMSVPSGEALNLIPLAA